MNLYKISIPELQQVKHQVNKNEKTLEFLFLKKMHDIDGAKADIKAQMPNLNSARIDTNKLQENNKLQEENIKNNEVELLMHQLRNTISKSTENVMDLFQKSMLEESMKRNLSSEEKLRLNMMKKKAFEIVMQHLKNRGITSKSNENEEVDLEYDENSKPETENFQTDKSDFKANKSENLERDK